MNLCPRCYTWSTVFLSAEAPYELILLMNAKKFHQSMHACILYYGIYCPKLVNQEREGLQVKFVESPKKEYEQSLCIILCLSLSKF